MNIDYCIIGLGNPGSKYFNTRHNIGFQVIDKLAEFFKIPGFDFDENFIAAFADYNDKRLMLVKPVTFMNLSGQAVKLIADTYGLEAGSFLILYDDANIPYGTLRIRPSGSDGGQNGIASVIYEMQTEDIPRLRVGIRNDDEQERSGSLADFVLSDFTADEADHLDEIVNKAKEAVLSYIDEGISAAMNKFNTDFLSNNKPSNGENNTNPN